MATFATVTPQVTVATNAAGTSAAPFIPEIWSDEIIAAHEKSLVLAPLVRKMSMKGKKGDTIHVPKPTRGAASVKTQEAAVTVQAPSNTELLVSIDQHYEYSVMIEDITATQALSSLRRFYTEDAGYAMAKNVDTSLFNLGVGFDGGSIDQDATATANWVGSSNVAQCAATTGNLVDYDNTTALAAFTDASLRDGLQILDDADVPMTGRFFVIPPSLVNVIRGITAFTSSDFVSFKQTSTGEIGNLYGVPIYVSTNVPSPTGTVDARMSLLAHKDVFVLAEQVGVRTQTQYKQEFLSTLMTADRLYGRQIYRPENGVYIATAP